MGFRLNIDKIEDKEIKNVYYGTKLYGYVDESFLLSFMYLTSIGKIDYDTFFNYGCGVQIPLNKKEFTIFANLYTIDLNKENENYGKKDQFNFIEIDEIKHEILDTNDEFRI